MNNNSNFDELNVDPNNFKGLNNRIQSRQSSRSELVNGNYNLNNRNGANDNSNNYFDYNLILQEMANFKKIIKNVLENQNDFQNKMIDNTRLLSEQDNITRLNNVKLNEHDSKLTEILVTFNNFMNFNEKTNVIIKELSYKYEDSAKKTEFNDLKMNLYNLKKNNEAKISECNSSIEDISLKYEELKREQDIFQKYTLEKLKNYQNESMENRIQQQQQLIKLEEARENKFNQQIEQIKIMIKNQEQNFVTENLYRKSAMENNRNEMTMLMNQAEEKINLIQKSSLEMEKKILNFSKDYIATFRDLISQNNENFEIEIKSLKNILMNNIIKSDKKAEDAISNLSGQVKSLSEILDSNKGTIDFIENTIKEKVSYFEKNLKKLTENVEDFRNIQNNIRADLENTITDLNKLINDRINLLNNKIIEKIKNYNAEIYEKYNSEKLVYENLISDNKEKIELFKNQFNSLISEINLKIERKIKDLDLEEINFDSKLNEKFSSFKDDNEEHKKKLILLINNHIDEAKKTSNSNQQELINNLSDKLDLKIENLKDDIENKMKNELIIREGVLHKSIIQTEEKLFNILEMKINPIQDQIDSLNDKFSVN